MMSGMLKIISFQLIYLSILKLSYIWLAGVNSHAGCMSQKLCQQRDWETIWISHFTKKQTSTGCWGL